jgi:MFS family permease
MSGEGEERLSAVATEGGHMELNEAADAGLLLPADEHTRISLSAVGDDGSSGCCGIFAPLLNKLPMLRTRFFYLLTTSFFMGTGCGLFVLNNVGDYVVSANGGVKDDALKSALVISFTISSGISRIVCGFTMDRFTRVRRGVFYAGFMMLMAATNLATAASYARVDPQMLYATVIAGGISYGGLWCTVPTILSEQFGLQDFGKNYGTVAIAPGIAGAVFNGFSGAIYDNYADSEGSCIGSQCFAGAFLFSGSCCAVGAVLSLFLVKLTKIPPREDK